MSLPKKDRGQWPEKVTQSIKKLESKIQNLEMENKELKNKILKVVCKINR